MGDDSKIPRPQKNACLVCGNTLQRDRDIEGKDSGTRIVGGAHSGNIGDRIISITRAVFFLDFRWS
jgi:hypothetical protein